MAKIDKILDVMKQITRNQNVDQMNRMPKGHFTDLFPRYQDNFQFHGKNGMVPSEFRVSKQPDGYHTDANMHYGDAYITDDMRPINEVDVPRMNMYGNGDFMNTDGLMRKDGLLGRPEYIMGNEFPQDDYIVDPMRKITQSIDNGTLDASSNMDGQLAGTPEWYSNKPTNTNDIYLDRPDDWDKFYSK